MELSEQLLDRTRSKPEGPEGSEGVHALIEAIATPLLAERDQLVAKRDDLMAQRALVDADIRTIDKVLSAINQKPTGTKQKQKRYTPPRPKPGKLNATQLRILRFVADQPEPVTVNEVRDNLNPKAADSVVQKALKTGRDLELIRKAGMRKPVPGQGGRESILYAPFSDTLKRLEAVS